jgi:hypothetical protein
MRGALVLAMLGGCGFSITFGEQSPDAMSDASTTDGPCQSFSTFTDTCELPMGTPLELTGTHTFDTDSGLLTDAIGTIVPVKTAMIVLANNGIDVQAIFVGDLVLDGTLIARGTRPFAIISTGSIDLVGNSVLEVGMGGAGARATCPNPALKGENDSNGGGGGGGGALGADGGHGGDGDSDNGRSDGAIGGKASEPPTAIIGGCRGGAGGDGDDAGGQGGFGGGAIFVASAIEITIGASAGINAGGAGGGGGIKTGGGDAGGAGGGSGGTILLESPRVRNDGTLSANGGGGGEGSDNGGSTGDAGTDALLGTQAASGGDGNSGGGSGGSPGGNSSSPAGASNTSFNPGGGGGGGGSVGFIRIVAASMQLGSKVSPLPQP